MNSLENLGVLPEGRPESIAIIDLLDPQAPRICTYGQLKGLVSGVATHLASLGLPPRSSIAILSLNRLEFIAAYLGIMQAGHVAVPVNIKLKVPTIEAVLADCNARYLFVDKERESLTGGLPHIGFDDPGAAGFKSLIRPFENFPAVQGGEAIAQILYTSGSTGMPKGVPLSHRGMLWALSGSVRRGFEEERQIVAQPLFHMNGLMVVKSVLFNGASIVVMPAFNAGLYSEALERWQVTRIFAVPTMLARVLREVEGRARDYSRIGQVTLSSAPATEALIRRVAGQFPSALVDVSYGCTEGGPRIFGPHPSGLPKPMLALGTPAEGCEVRLEGGNGPDEGELYVRNPAVMPGYLNLPARTAEVLRDGWYRTGDVMRRDENGFHYFVGRADDMFICSGENIYPGEVEKMLELHPAVQQAAIVPLPDEERGQIPAAFIVLKNGMQADLAAIRAHALASGPAYQHPRRVAFLPELPLAGTNKIDRKQLMDEAARLERSGGWSR